MCSDFFYLQESAKSIRFVWDSDTSQRRKDIVTHFTKGSGLKSPASTGEPLIPYAAVGRWVNHRMLSGSTGSSGKNHGDHYLSPYSESPFVAFVLK